MDSMHTNRRQGTFCLSHAHIVSDACEGNCATRLNSNPRKPVNLEATYEKEGTTQFTCHSTKRAWDLIPVIHLSAMKPPAPPAPPGLDPLPPDTSSNAVGVPVSLGQEIVIEPPVNGENNRKCEYKKRVSEQEGQHAMPRKIWREGGIESGSQHKRKQSSKAL